MRILLTSGLFAALAFGWACNASDDRSPIISSVTVGVGGAGGAGGAGGGGMPRDPYELACEGPTRVLDAITWNPTPGGGKYLAEAPRVAWFCGSPDYFCSADVDAIAAKLMAQPAGSRALIFGLGGAPDYASTFDRHAEDKCRTATNVLTEFPCPWFDHGAQWLGGLVEPLFAALAKKGVPIDALLLDAEVGLANWTVLAEYKSLPERTAYWNALEADPRMAPVLAAAGIATPLHTYVEQFGSSKDYLKWNAAMDDIVQGYIAKALATTFGKHFPKAEISNYGAYRYNASLDVPDYNGHHPHLFGDGTVVGTHQSREVYGWIEQLAGDEIAPGVALEVRPYDSLLYAVNHLRVMPLAAPTIPFHSWIAARSYKGDGLTSEKVSVIGLADTDLWQELVFHNALAGGTRIAHWNVAFDLNDAALVASDIAAARQALEELNALAACADRATLIDGLAAWDAPFIVSGLRLEDHELWRVTPNLDGPTAPAIEATLVSKDPASFAVGERSVTFTAGRVYEPASPASKAGFWVVQPKGAPKPLVK